MMWRLAVRILSANATKLAVGGAAAGGAYYLWNTDREKPCPKLPTMDDKLFSSPKILHQEDTANSAENIEPRSILMKPGDKSENKTVIWSDPLEIGPHDPGTDMKDSTEPSTSEGTQPPPTPPTLEEIRRVAQNFRGDARRHTKQVVRSETSLHAPHLEVHHKRARLRFALKHVNWQLRHWRRVSYCLQKNQDSPLTSCDGRLRVWRRHGERLDEPNILEIDRFSGGLIMVWAGISLETKNCPD
ncbi:hypothetical protein ANN_27218 [Periplaneta americana]|uniref:Transposase Tc1-like domain-containing protein n=1 Tax=Periplaneta americana TaxID=6978 RepID=A0ABQ8RXH6_PERAM|nr:hypothetical protein ANN_27218 [Periplaneta americana]